MPGRSTCISLSVTFPLHGLDIGLANFIEAKVQHGLSLILVDAEARDQSAAAWLRPVESRMIRDGRVQIGKDLGKPLQNVQARLQGAQVVIETLLHHFEAEVEKMAECLQQTDAAWGRGGGGPRLGDQAGQVEVKIGLQLGVLVEIADYQLRVGVALALHDNAHVVGRFVVDVEHVRQFAIDDVFGHFSTNWLLLTM